MATPARTRTRLAPADRRAQILAAARRVFGRQPLATVSVEAVAREAGTTPGLVHHYFGGRHDLYLAVVREMFRSTPALPEPVPGETFAARLSESTTRWLDMVEANRETWLASIGGGQGIGGDAEVEAIFERVRERAVDNLVELLGAGPAADAPPVLRALLRSFGGLAEAATREWLQKGRIDRAQTHALLTASLTRLLDDVLPLLS